MVNGVIAVPIMAMLVLLASNRQALGAFVLDRPLRVLGWLATVLMSAAVALMFWSMLV